MLFPHVWLRSTGFPTSWLDRLALPPEGEQDPEVFEEHMSGARRALVELLSGPLPNEALFLSNPAAVSRLAGLAQADLGHVNSRNRQRLRLAWGYLQRLCAKNETVSFYGPLAWGRVRTDTERDFTLWNPDPDAGWLRNRRVCFEHWVVERLCARIAESHADSLPLILHPGCDLDGDELRYPVNHRMRVPASVADYVRAVGRGEEPGDAPAAIGQLTAAGVLRRGVEPAPGTEQPLRVLHDLLERRLSLPEGAQCSPEGAQCSPGGAQCSPEGAESSTDTVFDVLGVLAELERLRNKFEQGGHAERTEAQASMLAVLTEAGVDVGRESGTLYAGRSPVYEDCERNVRFEIGGSLADRLTRDLPRVLRPYRLVAECVAVRLNDHYAETLKGLDGDDFVAFLAAVRSPAGNEVLRTVTGEIREALADAWATLPPPAEGRTELTDAQLERVEDLLHSRYPGHGDFSDTLGVGTVSPDVMFAAPDLGALRLGRAGLVLGEVHPCVLTALQPVPLPFLTGSERADALDRADALLGEGRVLLATTGRDHQRSQISRPVTPHLYEVEVPGAVSRCPERQRIPAGRGRTEVRGGRVHFVDRETGRTEDMVTLLSSDLHRVMFDLAADVLGGGLPQRLVHRGIVVKRRSWRFRSDDVPTVTRPAEVFAEYRRLRDWALEQGLPRRSFFKTDAEAKPLYLDWASPLAVDTFVRLVHQAGAVKVTELRPGFDELWLSGSEGVHTAEVRMSFVV